MKILSNAQLLTWNTDQITSYAKPNWADSHTISIYTLQQKVLALFCLATMTRPRSDIGQVQARDVKFAFDSINNNNELTGTTIHF